MKQTHAMSGSVRVTLLALQLVLVAVTTVCTAQNASDLDVPDPIRLPKPSGTHKVGTDTYWFEDATRREIRSIDRSSRRQLGTQVWYPAMGRSACSPTPYAQELSEHRDALSHSLRSLIPSVRTNSCWKVEVSDEQETYPLILFSPGFGTSRHYYTAFCEGLASHGYVVAAIDHPYLNPVVTPDGRFVDPDGGYWHSFPAAGAAASQEEAEAKLEEAFDNFSQDQLFVLAELSRMARSDSDSPLYGRIDPDRAASLGHSAGALAPHGLIKRSHPFKAYALYDVSIHEVVGGPQIAVEIEGSIGAPVLLARLEYAAPPDERFTANLEHAFYDVVFEGAAHDSPMDLPYLLSMSEGDDTSSEKAERLLQTIIRYTRSFLNRHVKGDRAAWPPRCEPGTRLHRYGPMD